MKTTSLLLAVALTALSLSGAATKKLSSHKRSLKKRVVKKRSRTAVHPVPVVYRRAAFARISSEMSPAADSFRNAAALVPFFDRLYRAGEAKTAVHILQYGDSHTASDDWVNAMRQSFQARFGSGGPGFGLAGHPYRGYRRFDLKGSNSPGWHTEGLVGRAGDERYGLGGVSITAEAAGETVTMSTECDELKLCYLQQPGGGSVDIEEDGEPIGTVSTNGDYEAGFFEYQPKPGAHQYTVRTVSAEPVRLFGWVAERNEGVTLETLGINGAQVNMIGEWDGEILRQEIAERDPALITVAYGTNEALSPKWTAEEYRQALTTAVARLREAAPEASIALIGPPDCFLRTRRGLAPFPHLDDVIRIQREVARESGCAFWDWRERMGGRGSKKLWVQAGLAQADYVHLTPAGYQMLGRALFEDLMEQYGRFMDARTRALESSR